MGCRGLGFRVWGLGFRVLGFRVWGCLGFGQGLGLLRDSGFQGSGLNASGLRVSGLRVSGWRVSGWRVSGWRVQGCGFRVAGNGLGCRAAVQKLTTGEPSVNSKG